MSRKKIKNPLIKRIPKEIIGDWKKYLVVFLFLVLTIGFVSISTYSNPMSMQTETCLKPTTVTQRNLT